MTQVAVNQTRTINPVTKNPQIRTSCEYVAMGSTVQTNVNGTPYRLATVRYTTPKGTVKQANAIIYETAYQKAIADNPEIFTPGNQLLLTVENTGLPEPLLTIAGLPAGGRAAMDDFDWSQGNVVEPSETAQKNAKEFFASDKGKEFLAKSGQQIRDSAPAKS